MTDLMERSPNLDHDLIRRVAEQRRPKAKRPNHYGKREAQAVARAAQHLDYIKPNWAHSIKMWRLDLSSCRYCILGQIYGDFLTGLRSYHNTLINRVEVFIGHGFINSHYIKKAWRKEIRARR